MKDKPAASLIIAVYNWTEALDLCLGSVLRQTELPGEVIIADDGSGPAVARIIDRYRQQLPVPVKHVWQPDEGFKLAQIRNKAVAASTGEYIIQIDGDLILHPSFVKDHMAVIRKRYFVGGSRVFMDQSLSLKLLSNRSARVSLFERGIRNRLNGLHAPWVNRLLRGFVRSKGKTNIRGCNMAYWRSDFIQVNGYNEDFQGWGREDTDLVLRFYALGLNRIFFKFRGIVFHLYHKEADRSRLETNDQLLLQARDQGHYCSNGIDKYLQPSPVSSS
jgi:glycosyltransferase involved in cell wall biosynthesis